MYRFWYNGNLSGLFSGLEMPGRILLEYKYGPNAFVLLFGRLYINWWLIRGILLSARFHLLYVERAISMHRPCGQQTHTEKWILLSCLVLESHGSSFYWDFRPLCTCSSRQPPARKLHHQRRWDRDRDSHLGRPRGAGYPSTSLQSVLELGGQPQVTGPNQEEAEKDDGWGK